MKKHEFYPEYHDLFEYFGSNEIARVRIKGGRAIRMDWLVFDSVHAAMVFLRHKCGGGRISNRRYAVVRADVNQGSTQSLDSRRF